MKRCGTLLWLFAFLAWTLFIFQRSLQPTDLTRQESQWVLELLARILPFTPTMTLVRKAAHFTEFSILGILAGFPGMGRRQRRLLAWLALSVCVMVALSDETIQLFVEGRTGQVPDVWLDIAGAAWGIALSLLLHWILGRGRAAGGQGTLSSSPQGTGDAPQEPDASA